MTDDDMHDQFAGMSEVRDDGNNSYFIAPGDIDNRFIYTAD